MESGGVLLPSHVEKWVGGRGRRGAGPARRPVTGPPEANAWAHAVEPATFIHFIGVWDTGGALGNPLMRHSLINRRLRFHDLSLSSYLRNAFQALAIDEYPLQFQPALWRQQPHPPEQVLRQAPFVG